MLPLITTNRNKLEEEDMVVEDKVAVEEEDIAQIDPNIAGPMAPVAIHPSNAVTPNQTTRKMPLLPTNRMVVHTCANDDVGVKTKKLMAGHL